MPIAERELIAPTLEYLAQPQRRERGATVTELEPYLRQELDPSGPDLAILQNRIDDRFSQKVRNVVSHRTLVKSGFARFRQDGLPGHLVITSAGLLALKRMQESSNQYQPELPLL